jgi:hypothetical protein
VSRAWTLPARWRRRPAGVLDLRFEELHRHRPRSLFSPFLDHDVADPPMAAGGELTRLGRGPRVPFCAVSVDVDRLATDGSVVVGLAGDGSAVLARWSAATREVSVEVTGSGGTSVVGVVAAELTPPFQLAVAVQENQVTVLAAPPGEELRPLITEREGVRAVVDLRDPAVLGGVRYAFGATGDAHLSRFRAGLSGPVGVRDPQAVRRPDGSPVVVDGKLLLTMTCAGLGFFQQAYWGVWTLHLADPAQLQQVGALFFERDGLLLGDHAGHLVVDEDAGRTIVLVSSWGDHDVQVGVHVRHLTTSADLLSGVHVLRSERLQLPTRASAWDPSLARVDGRWRLAFVECVAFEPRYTFHPAVAVAGGADYDQSLTAVAVDAARLQTEGTLLQRVEDRWYVMASDGDAREYPVYDTDLRRQGALAAPYGTNIPHPLLVRAAADDRAPWWLVTFDGTPFSDEVLGYGTHGDFVVLAAAVR